MGEAGIDRVVCGDELVEPHMKPAVSQIRNSNAYQLLSQVVRAGGKARYYGIAPDTGDYTFDFITRAINENDIVILTGGVSMGDFDFVPAFLKKAGVKILFNRINVQPGKPTTFGIHPQAVIFGLPGNPVSSFIQFETLVRPLMAKMMDSDWKPVLQTLPMGARYMRKSVSRMGWIPVFVNENGEAMPVEYHGSAHLSALPFADGIIRIEPGVNVIEKGDIVKLRYL
jgi:molybdopterin molybdotransferase